LAVATVVLFILMKVKKRVIRERIRKEGKAKICFDVSERQADWRRG